MTDLTVPSSPGEPRVMLATARVLGCMESPPSSAYDGARGRHCIVGVDIGLADCRIILHFAST
jgi:hypothetical protein